MLVAANPTVKSGKDLNGKTIGTPGLNTLGEYGVRAWVDANGGDSTTLRFVELPFPVMPAALARRAVVDRANISNSRLAGRSRACKSFMEGLVFGTG